MKIKPVVLNGQLISLEPLQSGHLDELCAVGLDKSLWLWTVNVIETPEDMRRYVETALDEKQRGVSMPFVMIEKFSNKIVGSTRFGNIDVKNWRAEIGWTWINPKWQRSFVNTEAKLLMLAHAFETWQCIRVEFKTDALNEKSRNAILRLGAKEEGILRQHMITETGRFRDTIYFSIINVEWQDIKANLNAKIRNTQ